MFVMWLAEQITARGIGQGASLLIFAGIIAQIPEGVAKVFSLGSVGQMSPAMIMLVVAFVIGIVALIAFFEQAQRRIQILYPRWAYAWDIATCIFQICAGFFGIKYHRGLEIRKERNQNRVCDDIRPCTIRKERHDVLND
mgnify:CR=1 FL=1